MKRGEYLEKKIDEKGFNVMTLSKASGVAYTTIRSMIERNLNNASIDSVIKICKVLGIRIEDFQNSTLNTAERNAPHFTKEVTELEIVGSICCGNGTYAFEDIQGTKEVPNSWIKGAEHFLLRADGDSMINARIYPGDLLLIRKQEDFEQGAIMAIMLGEEAVLKKIYRTDGSIMLQSENPNYPPKFLNDEEEIRIIGKLKMNLIEY